MENHIVLSIIVPTYNSSLFLDGFMDVYFKFLIKNKHIELIIIDDGSVDDTAKYLEDYKRKGTSNLKVIFNRHEGPGVTRNIGLNNAIGKYVFFADIDDIINGEALLKFISKIEESSPELLVFGYCQVDLNKETRSIFTLQDYEYEMNTDNVKKILTAVPYGFLWNKIFRRDIISENGLLFGQQSRHEDAVFILTYLKYIKKVTFCSDNIYTYNIRKSSTSHKQEKNITLMIRDFFDRITALENLLQYYGYNRTDAIFVDKSIYFSYVDLCIEWANSLGIKKGVNYIKNLQLEKYARDIIIVDKSVKSKVKYKALAQEKYVLAIILGTIIRVTLTKTKKKLRG